MESRRVNLQKRAETEGDSAKKAEIGENWESSQQQRPYDATRRSRLVRERDFKELLRQDYAAAKPSQAAKPSGTPNRRIVTRLAVGARALRSSRSRASSRECARGARERGAGTRSEIADRL